jgi:thioredoxin-related protein
VVKVDATLEAHLAEAFSVRSAPTVLLADADGTVQARLVGTEAVEEYVRAAPVGR